MCAVASWGVGNVTIMRGASVTESPQVVPGAGFEPTRLSAAGFKPAASAIPPPRPVQKRTRTPSGTALSGFGAAITVAVKLQAVTLEREAMAVGLFLDASVHLGVGELSHLPAVPANQMVVVFALG